MAMENFDPEPAKRRPSFWRALLLATLIEVGMLIPTGLAMVRSFFAHSAADPNSASNNPLANVGIYFHLPSFIITAPFGLFFLAPLVQILLLSGLLFMALRWWEGRWH